MGGEVATIGRVYLQLLVSLIDDIANNLNRNLIAVNSWLEHLVSIEKMLLHVDK